MPPKKEKITVNVKVANPKKKNNNKKKKSAQATSVSRKTRQSFAGYRAREFADLADALIAPEIWGPARIPRAGSSGRTGLGMDIAYVQLGSTTNYSALSMQGAFTSGGSYATYAGVPTSATAFAGATGQVPGLQFPAAAQVLDCSLVGGSLLLSYNGAPLNATGEILIGTIPLVNGLTGATFDSLSFYPGVIRLPVSSLIGNPLRVSLRHNSPVSWEFMLTTQQVADIEIPFVVLSTTAAANVVTCMFTRTWEYRSQVSAGNVVPYQKATESFSQDLDIFQDVTSYLSEMANMVTEGAPEWGREMFLGGLGSALSNAASPSFAHGILNTAVATYGRLAGGRQQQRIFPI